MTPKVAIDVTARDKTDAGLRSAERKVHGFAQRTAKASREGGFERISRQVEGLSRLRTVGFGFEALSRGLGAVGGMARDTSEAVGGMTRNVLTFGAAGGRAMGVVAAGATTATAAVAGLAAAVVGLGVGTYMFGEKWAKIGGALGRKSQDLGVSAQSLQARRAAAERFGVSADDTDSAIDGLGSTLYDAKYGGNNLALGALNQLGLKLKEKEDGSVDTDAMLDDIADAIAKQKNPQVQKKLAAIFGVSSMLPALREGSGALKAEGADYMKSGSALTDAEIATAREAERKAARLRQQLAVLEKTPGVAAMKAVGPMADAGVDTMRAGGRAVTTGGELVRGGREAGRELIEGAKKAAREFFGRDAEPEGRAAAPSRGGGRAGAVRGGSRAAQAMAYFQSMGWTPAQAAGIVANISEESGFDHTAVGDGGRAYGLAQHHPDRQANFKKRFGKDMKGSSFEEQLAFIHHEMTQGTERAAGNRLRNARTAAEAGAVVSRYYERPRDADGEAADRSRLAEKIVVDINLKGAPQGTVAVARGGGDGVKVAMNVQRGMEGP